MFSTEELYHFEFWAFIVYHLTIATLIGLAFRKTDDHATAWQFAGVILVSWLMTVGALLLIHHPVIANFFTPDAGMYILQCYVWTQVAARPVVVVLYAVVHWLRYGVLGWKSFTIALASSCLIAVSWTSLAEDFLEFEARSITREAFWMGFTSCDVIFNWILWYWFLFRPPKGLKRGSPALQPA